MEQVANLLSDVLEGYSDRYDRLEFLAVIYNELEALAKRDGFGPGAVAAYAAAMARHQN